MDLSDYARNVLFCNGKMLGINKFLHKSTMYTDTNHNGLHTGTDISEITKSGFVWFCKKAPQMGSKRICFVRCIYWLLVKIRNVYCSKVKVRATKKVALSVCKPLYSTEHHMHIENCFRVIPRQINHGCSQNPLRFF